MPSRERPEDLIQQSILAACKVILRDDVKVFAVPNGEKRDWQSAKRLKMQGVMAGMTDLVFLLGGGAAFLMEVKTKKGSFSKGQRDLRKWCTGTGTPWCVVRSREEAIATLKEWNLVRPEYRRAAA